MNPEKMSLASKRHCPENEYVDVPFKKFNADVPMSEELQMNVEVKNAPSEHLLQFFAKMEQCFMNTIIELKTSMDAAAAEVNQIGKQMEEQSDEMKALKEKLRQIQAEVALSKKPMYEAMYSYQAQEDEEVSFHLGDIIVNPEPRGRWMIGTVKRTGARGMLPSNYVKLLVYACEGSRDNRNNRDGGAAY